MTDTLSELWGRLENPKFLVHRVDAPQEGSIFTSNPKPKRSIHELTEFSNTAVATHNQAILYDANAGVYAPSSITQFLDYVQLGTDLGLNLKPVTWTDPNDSNNTEELIGNFKVHSNNSGIIGASISPGASLGYITLEDATTSRVLVSPQSGNGGYTYPENEVYLSITQDNDVYNDTNAGTKLAIYHPQVGFLKLGSVEAVEELNAAAANLEK